MSQTDDVTTGAGSAAETDSTIPFRFTGSGSEYFKIWIVNLCLTIITFGIYSAWAKVRRNRYFYGNTTLAGNSFEYLADPVAILKGRVIAFTCLAVYTFLPHVTMRMQAPRETIMAIQIGLPVVLMFVFPWFMVRSLAFRARNTAYRNIRFRFQGNYGQALLEFIVLPVLLFLPTLGLIYPYLLYRQKRLIVAKSGFGTSPFQFTTPVHAFYILFGLLILLSVVAVPVFLFLTMITGAVAGKAEEPVLIMTVVYLLTIAFYTLYFAYFRAYMGNIVYNGIEIDGHKLQSNLATGELFRIYFTNILGILFTLGLYIPWARVRVARYLAEHLRIVPAGELDNFVSAQKEKVGAAGEELGEMFDFDIGL